MMVEVLIAVSIIAFSILAAMTVTQKSVSVSRQAFHMTEAGFLLSEGAEAVRIIRDNTWNNISSLVAGVNYYPSFLGGTWTLSQTVNNVGIFTRTIVVSNINRDNTTKDISSSGTDDPGTKLITVTVSWEEGGITVVKNLQFYITDIFS